jgi:hypothetical protein
MDLEDIATTFWQDLPDAVSSPERGYAERMFSEEYNAA